MNFHFVTGHNSDSKEPTTLLATFDAQAAKDTYEAALEIGEHEYVTLFRNAEVTKRGNFELHHSPTGSALRVASADEIQAAIDKRDGVKADESAKAKKEDKPKKEEPKKDK